MLFKVIQQKVEDMLTFLCSANIYGFLKPNRHRILYMCSPILMRTVLLPQKFACNADVKDFGEYVSVRN